MNLKILSLLLMAILSLGAVLAGTASAEGFKFHSDGSLTKFTGSALSGGAVFTVDAGQIKCTSVTYHGEMTSSTAEEIGLEESTSECTWGTDVVVTDWNGCFNFYVPEKTTSITNYDTTDYWKCPTGKEITVTAFNSGVLKCTWHYPPQDVGTSEWFENAFSKDRLSRKYNKIKYSQTAGTGLGACSNAVSTTNGEYSEEMEIQATNSEGKATEFWLE